MVVSEIYIGHEEEFLSIGSIPMRLWEKVADRKFFG
jgi:hypothetical protein